MAKSAAMELRKQLLNKEAELLGTDKPEYKTNGVYRPYSDSQRNQVDIITASVPTIVSAYQRLLNYTQACKELGLEDATHLGYSIEDWKTDMKLRIAVINRSATLRKIEEVKTKLRGVLTAKELREIGIDDLSKEVGDLVG